jgi:adenylate cyclase
MTETLSIDALRNCLEGVIPASIATVATDGTPNITYVSQVHYVDKEHVALSFQFFNKTRENILSNPYALVQVVDPDSAAHYRIAIRYLCTETEGPLFENMKAKLAGIASHTGMSKVFHLLGADVYKILSIEGARCERLPCALPQRSRLAALRSSLKLLAVAADLEQLFEQTMFCLREYFETPHAILLMYDRQGERLYTVASNGYEVSGIGAEIPLGMGVIGVAAQQRTPIRIMYMTGQYAYNKTVRDNLLKSDPAIELETEIPFAGLADPHSQIAVPISLHDTLLGVLYADSPQDLRFTYEDEDAFVALTEYLALGIQRLHETQDSVQISTQHEKPAPQQTAPADIIRHFAANDSIFLNDEYLIKGVAGAILWKLLKAVTEEQRAEFSNRELRLDPAIGLPEIGDNLEARLILLQKRLRERCDYLRIEKTGRGRFSLKIDRVVTLQNT